MKKEKLQIIDALCNIKSTLNPRLRFFIGSAINDALALGHRSEIITEAEALALQDVVNSEILDDVRNNEDVKDFLSKRISKESNAPKDEAGEISTENGEMTPRHYYDIFIKPALEFILDKYAERIGTLFVKYICTGEPIEPDTLTEDEKLLWNVFMAMVEIKFNAELTAAISDTEA